ncbi:MAG: P-II family nitrogen regulator [Saprospiraceae bacterium]|nr:P-II family nitrogen regulator [Saprospiraceae bacterium]
MKKVEAIIRTSKYEDVVEALEGIGIRFFSYSEVKGHGMEKSDEIVYRGAVYDAGYIPRTKLSIVIKDEDLEKVTSTIIANAQSGKIGDGKIIITNVEQFIRIRTGESSEDAL